ncbi:MAG: ankyrin repeat domain-containing protein [Sphingomicrobium sp.]
MNAVKCALIAVAAAGLSVPASAQVTGFEGAQFVKAIQDGKSDDAAKLLQDKPTLVNARDLNGQTALLAAIGNRDSEWTGYLLQQGADPNMAGPNGETPLIAAARAGFQDAVDWLLQLGARVNDTNRAGETALIIAVQRRQVPIVRALLNAGADPDKTDAVAGYSARDYAKRDSRTPDMLRLIEAKKPGR